jgi:hypothetical protein
MADTQDIIVRYISEVEESVAQIEKLAKAQDKITDAEKEQADQAKKTSITEEQATKKRIENLRKEESELKKLQAAKKKAFTVSDISDFNKKINESQNRISLLKNEISGAGSITSKFSATAKSAFLGIAAGAAAAFSTQAIINFSQESIKAFLDAEKNAERLRFAITAIGGESELQFERLIKQSSELQKITVFSDDSIQQAQAALSAFGLTADEIERLIPKLADFATVAGVDITQAVEKVGAGLEGNGRELKKYQIEVSTTASRLENLNSITEGFTRFQGAAAAATQTLTGQLEQQKNQVDDLQELIGEKLAPSWVKVKQATYEALLGLLGYNKALEKIKEDNSKAVADNFQKAAEKIKASGGDVVAEFTKRRDEIVKVNESIKKSNEELEKVFGKLGFENQKRANREQIERNNEIIASNDEKIKRLQVTIESEVALVKKAEADKQKALERTLVLDELRKKSAEELNTLLVRENEISDDFTKKNVENINLVIKEQEKLTAAREKAAAEYEKNLQLLANLQIQNIDDEKQRRIAAFEQEVKELTATGKLRADIITQLEAKLVNDLNEIDKKRNVDQLFRVPEITVTVPDEIKLPIEKTFAEFKDGTDNIEKTWLDANERILASSIELFGELTGLFSGFTDARIERINSEKEAALSSIDAQIAANEEALKNRQISNRTEEQLNKQLAQDKVETEKKADKEIRKIQRQQAILDKANAIFQIALSTAIALADAKNLATFGALSPIIIALGAAQIAAVAAAPIPGFEKGTKGKKGSGIARVGESGEELMYLPHGAKVVPNKETRRYADVIDNMIDGNLEKYIHRNYVMPQLLAQKAAYERGSNKGDSFTENVSKSARYYQPPSTTNVKFPSGMNIDNVNEFADAIANRITISRRRQI